jgi:hypothetical protein
LWEQAVPQDIPDRTIVLAVDAVAFRPLVTVTDGEVRGPKHLKHLDDHNSFTHFLKDLNAFIEFLHKDWEEAYSSMLVFQIQPIHPSLPCPVIRVYPVEYGKGTQDTVATLLKMKTSLEAQFRSRTVGPAFDGDSCFNGLHDEFAAQWRKVLGLTPLSIPIWEFLSLCVITCDPLRTLKRIRYHLLKLSGFLSPDERNDFSIDRIGQGHFLSPAIFSNLKTAKMHDPLSLELLFPENSFIYHLRWQSCGWRGYNCALVSPCQGTDLVRHIDADGH